MFKALKTISSKHKRNIRFIAVGSFQIEFFKIESEEFFTIYRMNYGSGGGAQYVLVELGSSTLARISDNEFQILRGISTYNIKVKAKNEDNVVHVTRYLWNWLPVSKYGGKVSNAGLSSLKANLSIYVNGSAV